MRFKNDAIDAQYELLRDKAVRIPAVTGDNPLPVFEGQLSNIREAGHLEAMVARDSDMVKKRPAATNSSSTGSSSTSSGSSSGAGSTKPPQA